MSNSNFDPDDIPDFPSTSEPGKSKKKYYQISIYI